MATRKRPELVREADLQPDRALPLFRSRLAGLDQLKGKTYDAAHKDEQEWRHVTEKLIERTFGNPSSTLSKWHMARAAGEHYMSRGGMPPLQLQKNFNARLQASEALLKSIITELQIDVPEEGKGAYEPGEEYAFYRDLKAFINEGKAEVLIIDSYLDESIFDIYVKKVDPGVRVRILTRNPSTTVQTVAAKYAAGHSSFQLRATNDMHDRVLFVDDRCWVIGQSIKDAARKKPTYLVEVTATPMRDIYEQLWATATKIVFRRALQLVRDLGLFVTRGAESTGAMAGIHASAELMGPLVPNGDPCGAQQTVRMQE